MNLYLPNLLVITEGIMDLQQQIDSIEMIVSSAVMSGPASGFQQLFKETVMSKFC